MSVPPHQPNALLAPRSTVIPDLKRRSLQVSGLASPSLCIMSEVAAATTVMACTCIVSTLPRTPMAANTLISLRATLSW